MVRCEKVVIDRGTTDENCYLVQCGDTPQERQERDSCLAYLRDCGHVLETEDHAAVGVVSWGELSDIIEPRDD